MNCSPKTPTYCYRHSPELIKSRNKEDETTTHLQKVNLHTKNICLLLLLTFFLLILGIKFITPFNSTTNHFDLVHLPNRNERSTSFNLKRHFIIFLHTSTLIYLQHCQTTFTYGLHLYIPIRDHETNLFIT